MKIRRDRNGLHLFDRRTGLNVLFDEVSVPEAQHDLAPRFVSIALTNACDLHCSFCYAPKFAARLDADLVLSWAKELDELGCLGVGFGGGEPTLHPDFVHMCRRIEAETQLAVSFTTHAHQLTDHMARELAGAVHFVRVSMDGVGSTYERIRGRSFATLLKKLALVRRISRFGVNLVVNSATIGDLDAAAEAAFESGASELLLLPERRTANSDGITDSDLRSLKRWILENPQFRLAVADGAAQNDISLAHPFDDSEGFDEYAHVDAAATLRATSFSPVGTPIGASIGAALTRLRTERIAR